MVKNTKILIVEDSATQAVQLEYMLEKNNYKVFIAKNGVEALEIIKDNQPGLVITDIIMPEMDGFELCRKIREDKKLVDLPIIMLTQLSKPEDVTKGLKYGANDFIIKPYKGKSLITHVKNIISIKNYQKYIKEKVKIMVVEDSSTQAESLKHLFENQGYKIIIANNGDEAMNLLQKESPSLIISDIIMHPVDGYELCKRIKKIDRFKDVPIILLTSLSKPLDIIHGVESRADYYFTKPYDESYLVSKVEDLLSIPLLQKKHDKKEKTKMSSVEENILLTFDNRQVIKLLLSTYENSIYQNRQLLNTKIELQQLNNQLENLVKKRTEKLKKEIAERKKTEKDLQKYRDELELRVKERTEELRKANRELESFSYSVSHDLRAPLRAINGFTNILMKEYAPQLSPEIVSYLQMTTDNAKSMNELISDLLEFSRMGRKAINMQQVSPDKLIKQILKEVKPEMKGRRIDIKVEKLPSCKADPDLLKIVFVNLISNSLKFTGKQDVAQIEIGCDTHEKEKVYFIKDNGVGFDMKYSDKLFSVFQRLHRQEEYPGTGVGLAIIKRIIERHGGQVWAEAKVDRGATFYFTLKKRGGK